MEPAPDRRPSRSDRISRVVGGFERSIVLVLMGLLVVIITLSTVDLILLIVRDVGTKKALLLNLDEMLELFGFFLMVLVGMELLASLKSYLFEPVIHVEVVLEVALVALAQKIIILDSSRAGGPTMFGLAALILALGAALWGIRSRRRRFRAQR